MVFSIMTFFPCFLPFNLVVICPGGKGMRLSFLVPIKKTRFLSNGFQDELGAWSGPRTRTG